MILMRVLKEVFRAHVTKEPLVPIPDNVNGIRFLRKLDSPSILVLTHSYQGNGAAEMLMFLLSSLVHNFGWQIIAYSSDLSDADKLAIHSIGARLVETIDPEQYDLAIANTVVSGLGHVERISPHLPCLLWVHEGETVLWNSQLALGYWKRIFATTAHIVFQTRWQAERIFGSFTSTLPESRYSVIPNCLPPINEIDGSIPPRHNQKKRIVFIGGIYARKRPHDLVQAVLKLGRIDVDCILIGTTEFIQSLPDSAQFTLKNDQRFRLTGELTRKDALAYVASADVLSLPSSDESQPLALLEAAHFNVPIVISDLPVYREYWHDGVNCLKHAVGDIDRLASHLNTCLSGNGPAPTILEDARINPDTFLLRYREILHSLVSSEVGATTS